MEFYHLEVPKISIQLVQRDSNKGPTFAIRVLPFTAIKPFNYGSCVSREAVHSLSSRRLLYGDGDLETIALGCCNFWRLQRRCWWADILKRRTSSCIDDSIVTTSSSAFWLLAVRVCVQSTSDFILPCSSLPPTPTWTCWSLTSIKRSVRWIASICGIERRCIPDGGLPVVLLQLTLRLPVWAPSRWNIDARRLSVPTEPDERWSSGAVDGSVITPLCYRKLIHHGRNSMHTPKNDNFLLRSYPSVEFQAH
jgi:hypothetical protein